MLVPTYDQFIDPLLHFLTKHPQGAEIDDVYDAVANAVGLDDVQRAELLPSGRQPIFKNRIGWAHDRLKRAGLSRSAKRGVWQLTDEGITLAKRSPRLSAEEVEKIADVDRHTSRVIKPPADGETLASSSSVAEGAAHMVQSPDDRIESAMEELTDSVARDLLERIGGAPPVFFETLVLELLHAMGYGASRNDIQRVGGAGDGGIDGVISLDRLGLEKVYVQAKRWQGPVGSPQIQTFMGALQLQGANKGVLLTTSTFTKDARDAAGRARGTVVLVDGARLTSLMIEHGVGVMHKMLKMPKVDGDYFEEG
jgi:restriction system protein